MNKLFNFTQAKGKWHKFLSFNLGEGAKLYKNFAQKLLAVSLCMAVVLLGVPTGKDLFANDATTSGYCGEPNVNGGKDVSWRITRNNDTINSNYVQSDKAYTLTISGKGAMSSDGFWGEKPWSSYHMNITRLQVNNGITVIGANAFNSLISLRSVSLPSSVTALEDNAFNTCLSLESLNLPTSLKSIGVGAFNTCLALRSVTIPASVSEIGMLGFARCDNLSGINVDDANPYFTSIDGVVYTKDETKIVAYPYGRSELNYAIPAGATTVGSGSFSPAKEPLSRASVTSAGPNPHVASAADAVGITSLTIPSGVSSVEDYAFDDCSSLREIHVPCTWNKDKLNTWFAGETGIKVNDDGKTFSVLLSEGGVHYSTDKREFIFDVHNAPSATCTQEDTCLNCGDIVKDPNKHTWDNGTTVFSATCGADGQCQFICNDCQKTKVETIPATGQHHWHNASCSVCGVGLPAWEAPVTVGTLTQHIRVYDPNGVLPEGTTLSAEAVTAHEHLDDDHEIEHLLAYDLSLLDASGNPLHMPLDAPVELCFEVLDGLDKDELEVVLVQEFDDAEFEENLVDLDGASWVKVKTAHFSPYALIDKLTPEEKGVQVQDDPGPKNNVTTGNLATQITVAGLGMTLVLALGIMLRLITSERKFEE